MKKRRELFGYTGGKQCNAFVNVRDGSKCWLIEARENCESMWEEYRDYADDNFLSDFAVQFFPRWFEMYLTVALLRAGVTVRPTGEGQPDVLAEVGGQQVWIEAVCPGPGHEKSSDTVRKPNLGCVTKVPIEGIIKRISSALCEKANKFCEYMNNKIVKPDDPAVVAIGFCGLGYWRHHYALECVCRTVGLVGRDFHVKKREGSPNEKLIDLRYFKDRRIPWISAVLVSDAYPVPLPDKIGEEFVQIPNPTSKVPSGINLPLGSKWGPNTGLQEAADRRD